MSDYLLDTNHLSPLLTLDHPLRRRILEAIRHGDRFALTTVNVAELLYGIGSVPRAAQNRVEWEHLRSSLRMFDVEEPDAVESAEMRIRLRRRGRQLGAIDALIAAIALRYDLTLLTTDGDFDAVPDLKRENWLPRAAA